MNKIYQNQNKKVPFKHTAIQKSNVKKKPALVKKGINMTKK